MYGVKEFVSNVLAVENVPESLILELESLKTDDHSNKICDYLLDKDAQFLFMAYSRAIGVAKEQFLTHCKSFGNSIFQEVIYQIITYIGLNICYSESELVNIIISALQISNTLYQHPASEETALSILKSLVERFKEEEHERNLIFNLISKQIIREIDNTESIMATSRTSKIADIIFILISHDKGTLLKKEFDLSSNMLTKLFSIIITPPNFFPNPNENGAFLAKDVNDAQYTIRTAMRLFHDQMHSLMLPLVKDVDSREKIMLWLSQIADSNVNRMKIQCDPRTISPDSLVYNILGVLQRLSRPFLDSNHSKMSLISTTNFYFRTRFDIDPTTTRLISSEQSLNFATKGKINFITECFHFTLHFFRLSVVRSISNYTEIARRTREINSFIEGNSNDPRMGIARTQLNSMNTSRIAIESLILDQDIMEDSWALIDVLCHWLSTISISNLGFNTKTDAASALSDLQESNSNTESDTATVYQDCENFLRFLPEYYVESIGEWLLFALRLAPRTFWGKRDCGHVLRFLCSHLDKPKYIKSPHLRAKFVDVLFGLLIYDVSPDDEESTSLNTQIIPNAPCTLDDAIKEQLPVALMRFYVEVEVTGASSQFYDKFNIRHVISAIFLRLLSAPECVDAITSVGTDDIFLRFTNLLLNDATYLLDEAMTKLSMIHDFEQSPTPPQPVSLIIKIIFKSYESCNFYSLSII